MIKSNTNGENEDLFKHSVEMMIILNILSK